MREIPSAVLNFTKRTVFNVQLLMECLVNTIILCSLLKIQDEVTKNHVQFIYQIIFCSFVKNTT